MKTHIIPDAYRVAGGRCALWARALVAIVFAYAFAWGVCALGAALLAWAGVARSEAVMVFAVAGFLVYLAAALWAVATRRLLRTAVVLGGGGVAMTLLARLAVHQLGAA